MIHEMTTAKVSRKPVHAVLTADIVNSTKLDPAVGKRLLKEFEKILKSCKVEFYRGDSFQAYMDKEPAKSLRLALICRTAAIMAGEEGEAPLSDLKISIGIGTVVKPVKSLGTAKGEAFLRSGRSLDYMQGTGRRLSIVTGNELADIGLMVLGDYIDAIYKRMTAKQAEAIYGLLKGETQQQVGLQLDKSKSTVSQLVSTGGWEEIERLLRQYENLINQLL